VRRTPFPFRHRHTAQIDGIKKKKANALPCPSDHLVYSLMAFRPNAARSVWDWINLDGIEKVVWIGGFLMLLADLGRETIMPIASVIPAVGGVVLVVRPAWRICSRAGFPGALGPLIMVPLLNLVLL
jgi:hypothetical protein